MNIAEAIRARKSIRGYKPDPVPRELLEQILGTAIRSPSALNAHSWEFAVVTGEPLENIKQGNVEMLNSGAEPNPDLAPKTPIEGVYKQRYVELISQLHELVGIPREDKQKRAEWRKQDYSFHYAPAVILLLADSSFDELRTQFDIGLVSQTICLAALEHGLGTCITLQGVMHPEVIRKFTGISQSKRIVVAIAIGYPDTDYQGNRIETKREPVEAITTWCGFD